MCELFGMSASHPLNANALLKKFRLSGGRGADNPDGWGLAGREKRGLEINKRPEQACRSRLFARPCKDMRSDLILAHVRKARFPPVRSLTNTHPFRRACCGKEWVFTHDGLVPNIVGIERCSDNPVCRPAGETDSGLAFRHLLGHIARHFDSHAVAEPLAGVENLAAASGLTASLGKFNFLMSDCENQIAYGHDRLHYLERSGCADPDGACANLAMVAAEPLGGEDGWIAFDPDELRVYRYGKMAGARHLMANRPAISNARKHIRNRIRHAVEANWPGRAASPGCTEDMAVCNMRHRTGNAFMSGAKSVSMAHHAGRRGHHSQPPDEARGAGFLPGPRFFGGDHRAL